MKKLHLCFLLVASSLFVWGCGDDSASNANNENGGSNLPPQQGTEILCDAGNEGLEIKPADSENPRVCTNGTWVEILSSSSSIKTPEPAEGSSSSSVKAPELAEGSSSSSVKAPEPAEGSSSSSVKAPELAEGSSSSSIKAPILSSSSTPIEDLSSSSEESKMYLCDDGKTYVLDLANCANSSSSSVIQSSSSTKKPEESSSSVMSSSSSTLISSSSSTPIEDPNSSSSSVVSSSSSAVSSSSGERQESSSSEQILSKIYDCSEYNCVTIAHLNPDIDYGEFLDTRDNQVYRTVKIGEQTWMAQNLNFASYESRCYRDSIKRCSIVGRLYTWNDAINVCPEGWHLPDTTEFNTLVEYVEQNKSGYSIINSLSSKANNSMYCKGFDFFGFSVVHGSGFWRAGYWGYDQGGLYQGNTYFWTSSESIEPEYPVENYAHIRYFYVGTWDALAKEIKSKANAYSVRCIKD